MKRLQSCGQGDLLLVALSQPIQSNREERVKQMAKKQAGKKRVFKCKTCGKTFAGGRTLGKHYTEIPAHRPAGKPVRARRGRRAKVATGFSAKLKGLLDSIDAEVRSHEQAIKDLQKKKEQLQKLNW